MAHLETIEKFADLKPHIELEDESLTMDKFKETDKVALIESAHPLPPTMCRQVAKKNVPSKTNPYKIATKKLMKPSAGSAWARRIKSRWLVTDAELWATDCISILHYYYHICTLILDYSLFKFNI